MNNYERGKIIAYAENFVSFLLSERVVWEKGLIEEIILFGSVARGDFNSESDVDIFINTKEQDILKKIIKPVLNRFYSSSRTDTWRLLGVEHNIVLKIGDIDKWKSLKRSVISDGLVLYGKYRETPEKLKHKTLIYFKPLKDSTLRIRISRKLFGYRIGKKFVRGLINKCGGERLGERQFMIPTEKTEKIIRMLNKEGVEYKTREAWTG